jgi:hypothetical protein
VSAVAQPIISVHPIELIGRDARAFAPQSPTARSSPGSSRGSSQVRIVADHLPFINTHRN